MSDTTNRDGQLGDAEGSQPHQSAEDASTSVTDHDAYQPLVDDGDAPTQQLPTQGDAPANAGEHDRDRDRAGEPQDEADDWQRSWDDAGGGSIEPTVIAPSTLRGPSHDAESEHSSLEQAPDEPVEHSSSVTHPDDPTEDAVASSRAVETGESNDPPELVEPRRPSLSLRGEQRPDLADTAPFAGLAGAGAGAAAVAGAGAASTTQPSSASSSSSSSASSSTRDEPAPTEAMPAQTALLPEQQGEPQFEVEEPAPAAASATETSPAPARTDERTQRLGSISVDDETARAAATGTPIVLVETATPPRKRGARGIGLLVALLSTIVFGALLAAAILGVQYLFEGDFVLEDAVQTIWLRPSWLLPVAVFLVAYWLTTLIVNRAGWWAHVLGGFLIAVLAYAAHVAGLFLETQSNVWDVTGIVDITGAELGRLLVWPTSIVAFVIAREVPIWFGGIVSKRGRRAKTRNKEALEEYETEQSRRLEEYEASRA